MKKKEMSYLDSVHRDGRIWGFILLGIIIAFPITLSLIFGVIPQWKPFLNGVLAVVPVYWSVGIVEVITYVPMLGAGGALLYLRGRVNGPQVHFFLYDRRRARSRRYHELDGIAVQDAMGFYLKEFAKDQISLWRELPKPLLSQLDAQSQFKPLVTYRLLYVLAEADAERIYRTFSEANDRVVTYLCHAIADEGDNEMADFVYHLKNKRIEDRERVVQFFQKNKQRFAARALKCVERNFELFYVPKSIFK